MFVAILLTAETPAPLNATPPDDLPAEAIPTDPAKTIASISEVLVAVTCRLPPALMLVSREKA